MEENSYIPDSTEGSAPVVEKEALIEKLQSVPEEVLRSILTNQVDLEIRLKHKELKLTEEEIGKCEAQMLALRKFFEVPNELSFRNEPNDFTLKYFDILNKSLSVNYTKLQQLQYAQQNPVFKETMFAETEAAPHSYRTRSTTSSLRPSLGGPAVRISGCLYRRTDGIIVKMTCPDCGRSNFSSAQGFLNHSRIAHSREYASQDSAALHCGEILPDEFQDEEGLASLEVLKQESSSTQAQTGYFGARSSFGSYYAPLELNSSSRKPSSTKLPEVSKKAGSQEIESKALLRDSINEGAGAKELMKRLISKGIARDAKEFEDLMDEIQKEVPNAHLFADEEETEEAKSSGELRAGEPVDETKKPEEAPSQIQQKEVIRVSSPSEGIAKAPELPDSSGKHENRLRRRKSRADMTFGGPDSGQEDGERRSKRRKSQR